MAKYRTEGTDVVFLTRVHNVDEFVESVARALGGKIENKRDLVFVTRAELAVAGGLVPLFVDEDGSAHMELVSCPSDVQHVVLRKLAQSSDFSTN